jgi:tetratricopeptide (TPR) repeat protein
MELGLSKRKDVFGVNSQELTFACKKVGRRCNEMAVKYMNEGKFEMSFEYLKRGENVTRSCDPEGLQMTFSNLASLYKYKGNFKSALRFIMLALDLESTIDDKNNLRKANIHLNICAIASQLGRHKVALKQAESAIKILKGDLVVKTKPNSDLNASSNSLSGLGLIKEDVHVGHDDGEEEDEWLDSHSISSNNDSKLITALAIAYYNAGAEHEHLVKFNLSYHCYQMGIKVLSHHFGDSHILVKTLTQSSTTVAKKIVKNNIR